MSKLPLEKLIEDITNMDNDPFGESSVETALGTVQIMAAGYLEEERKLQKPFDFYDVDALMTEIDKLPWHTTEYIKQRINEH